MSRILVRPGPSAADVFVGVFGLDLSEDPTQRVQFSAQLLHSPPQLVVVCAQLHHLLLGLQVAQLGLVSAFTHGHVVALSSQSVLDAAFVDVLLGFPSAARLQQLQPPLLRELVRMLVLVLVLVRTGHRGRRRSRVTGLQVHGGLRAVRNLVLEVRQLRLLGVVWRVVQVGRWHSRSQVLFVPRLLLNGHRAQALRTVLVQRLQFGVHVAAH